MMKRRLSYPKIEIMTPDLAMQFVKPGYPVFWNGEDGVISWIISFFTGEPTHVSAIQGFDDKGQWVHFESTTLNKSSKKKGCQSCPLLPAIEGYKGTVVIGVLREEYYSQINPLSFDEYVKSTDGIPYDYAQAVLSFFRWIPWGRSFGRYLYCVERVTNAWRYAGVKDLPGDQTLNPNQLWGLDLYSRLIQVRG